MSVSSEPSTGHGMTTEVAERTVVLPKHLHARPAGEIAQAAARNRATTIELIFGERRANARSVLAVMALGAVTGNQVEVAVAGPAAHKVADDIVRILTTPEDN